MMNKRKILVVDDEHHIVELIKYNLAAGGFQVIEAFNGEEALKIAKREIPDLLILDLMLPERDGYEVIRCLREEKATRKIPVIMLTAKGEEVDKVIGLEMGADDYVTKPFSPRELIARVKAVLRRVNENTGREEVEPEEIIEIGDIRIDSQKFEVYIKGKKIDFTPKEFELLKFLAINKGKVFSRDYLLEKIWGYEYAGDTRTVDVHIRHIRQKIGGEDLPQYIETIRGVGYKLLPRETRQRSCRS